VSGSPSVQGVAVFDLDGTITRRDTLVPYLVRALARHPARVWRLWVLPWAAAGFVLTRDRGQLKSRLVRAVLGGLSRAEIERLTDAFLDARLLKSTRHGAAEQLEAHRAAGDWLVLLSASTDFYVRAIGDRYAFDEVICTEVRWDADRLDGALATENRRGAEKARCIAALRERHPGARFAAYGNAASDLEHLAMVEAPLVVNASRSTRRRAKALQLPVADWP
jgi:phosphatidylglycerophosphatase C